MARFKISPQGSRLDVWTFKDGLLSAIAHDLQIAATEYDGEVSLEGDRYTIRLSVPVIGLRVQGAVKKGVTTEMSIKDRREIETTICGPKILDRRLYPVIEFAAQGTGSLSGAQEISGSLTLGGPTRPLRARVQIAGTPENPRVDGEVRILQSSWGVRPYSAMLGTLKVKDEVRVTWSLALAVGFDRT